MAIQQQGKNPNEVMCLVCQHCLTLQLQAGHTAGLADKDMEIQGYLCYRGRTDTINGITHLIFIIAFYTFMEYRNVWYVHGYEKCKYRMPQELTLVML